MVVTEPQSSKSISYAQAGVNIAEADAAKEAMAEKLRSSDARLLNQVGAFATLFDGRFPGMEHPILVLKTEEPGSKQLLAFQHGRVKSICFDMINHLINDIIVMGATPLSVQDCIICGKLDKAIVGQIVEGVAEACRAQGCVLTGGETSEQPGVLPAGTYVLSSSIVGVVDKPKIIDGSKIKVGDVVLAVASSGPHTNGYSLIRALMSRNAKLAERRVGDRTFLDAILEPHKCYYQAVRGLFGDAGVTGMAHITGSGIAGNLDRVLPGGPSGVDAEIELDKLRVPDVFKVIREEGNVPDAEMLRTFNMGVGLCVVVRPDAAGTVLRHLEGQGCEAYAIGKIVPGKQVVNYRGSVKW